MDLTFILLFCLQRRSVAALEKIQARGLDGTGLTQVRTRGDRTGYLKSRRIKQTARENKKKCLVGHKNLRVLLNVEGPA